MYRVQEDYKGDEKKMNYFAVYQRGCAVFGVGTTEEEAIEDAREWVDDFEEMKAQIEAQNDSNEFGKFQIVAITDEAKKEIDRCGGNICLEVGDDGAYTI